MDKITVIPMNRNRLWAGELCYSLVKVYPRGGKFYIGHFRTPYDYESEVEWLERHEPEPGPVRYEAHEESDWGIKGICDSAKYAETMEAIVRQKWEAVQKAKREYDEWKAGVEASGKSISDLPLIARRFPPLFGEPTLADIYRSCFWEHRPVWEAEKKRLHELAEKAEVGGCMPEIPEIPAELQVRYALRYLYSKDERDRIECGYQLYKG